MPNAGSSSDSARHFSFDEIGPLVEKLLACKTIKDLESRKTVLSVLRPAISENIQKSDTDNIHVTNIVTTCLNYVLGIQELVDIVRFYEKESIPMQALDAYIRELFPGVVTYNQFMKLKKIVEQGKWYKANIEVAYSASAPPGYSSPTSNDEANLLSSMLEDLAAVVKLPNGSVPLLTFVGHLTNRASGSPIQEKLWGWIRETADELGIELSLPSIRAIQNEAFSSLQVALVPSMSKGHKRELFRAQAWFWDGQNERAMPLHRGKRAGELTSLPALLTDLLEESEAHILDVQQELIVELFLPEALLNYNFDQWLIKVRSTDIPISDKYPTVVRSLDRATHKSKILMNDWKRLWLEFEKRTGNISLAFFYDEDCENSEFRHRLLGGLKQYKLPVFGLVPRLSDARNSHLLSTIIDLGTPVAFWLSLQPENFNRQDFQEICQALLSNCDISRLPKMVWDKRIEIMVSGSSRHPIYHLTLFWDNPFRVPRDLVDRFVLPSHINGEVSNEKLAGL